MRINLSDTTFLSLVRLDSVERLENVIFNMKKLCGYFKTNIVLREIDSYCNGILKSLINKNIHYEFIEDKDPVFYRTKHLNEIVPYVTTPYIAIWDVDIVVEKKSIINSVCQLRTNNFDVIYPYKGKCYNTSPLLRKLYFNKNDIRVLYRNINKMELLYDKNLVGGAVLMKKDAFIEIGLENENYYGWGNEDFDRYHRFIKSNYRICHLDTVLFHLNHPRGNNSKYRSDFNKKFSNCIYYKTATE